jgi:hypothetical protein
MWVWASSNVLLLLRQADIKLDEFLSSFGGLVVSTYKPNKSLQAAAQIEALTTIERTRAVTRSSVSNNVKAFRAVVPLLTGHVSTDKTLQYRRYLRAD